MRCACYGVADMAKMVQIRNVPDDIHRTMKARAARAGMSLSDYLLSEVRAVAARPTIEEMVERLRRRRAAGGPSSAKIIRWVRDAADRP